MKVIVFGATGMVGQGVLQECLNDPGIASVRVVTRRPMGLAHSKMREILHSNFLDLSAIDSELADLDACFYCLGVSSFRMREADYRHITYDMTIAAARSLVHQNPEMIFEYVSGRGTDSSEAGRVMWARVKGETENALLKTFRSAYMLRPGAIVPLDGIESKTPVYRWMYAGLKPLLPALQRFAPQFVTTTQKLGRAMIEAARSRPSKRILETSDIEDLAQRDERY